MERAFDYLFEAALTIGLLLVGGLQWQRRKQDQQMQDAIEEAERIARDAQQAAVAAAFKAGAELAEHKLYAAEKFARRDDMKDQIEKLEARLGERLDEIRDLCARHTKREQ